MMKKWLFGIVAALLCLPLCGCEFMDKLSNSPGAKYNRRMSEATEYSVEMTYQHNDEAVIYIRTSVKDGVYAYRFTQEKEYFGGLVTGETALVYRELWCADKHYKIEESTALIRMGRYAELEYGEKQSDKNPAECKENKVYYYTTMVTVSSFFAGMFDPVEEVDGGKTLQKIVMGDLTYWFDENDLLVKFVMVNEDEVTTVTYDNYKFENIDAAPLAPPSGLLYTKVEESELVFQFDLKIGTL